MLVRRLCAATLILGLLGTVGARAQAPTNAVTAVAAPPSPSPLTAEQLREIEAAKPNTRLVKTQPQFVSGPPANLPDSEKLLGHHGKVLVQGLLGVDGKMRYLTILTSSRAPALDQIALDATAGAIFQPAKDATGRAMPVPIAMPHEFYAYQSATGVGAAQYTCDQFVRDQDWYRATWPENPYVSQEFYVMMRGLQVAMAIGAGRSITELMAMREANPAFEARWRAAIETCRANPSGKFMDALKPEGDILVRLSANDRQPKRKR
jgi:TonB family protein